MKPNILVVDDSKIICNKLEKLINEKLHYNSICTHTKNECEKVLLEYENKFNVAILDLELPDSQSGEIIDLVTKFNIPSIALTNSINNKEVLKNDKVVDYVIKNSSFSFDYAISLVKRIINNNEKEILLVSTKVEGIENIIGYIRRYQLNPIIKNSSVDSIYELKSNNKIKVVYINPVSLSNYGLDLLTQIRKVFSKNRLVVSILLHRKSSANTSILVSQYLKYGANDIIYVDSYEEEFYSKLTSNLDMIDHFTEMQIKANKDFLTATFNRRYFFEEGLHRFNNSKNVKLCIIDIDKFKNINDTYGHDIGDIVIKNLVSNIKKSMYSLDHLIARFGAAEFAILVFNIDDEKFLNTLESLRKSFEDKYLETTKGTIIYTISIGYSIEKLPSLDGMINNANKGLYKIKNSGRNHNRNLHED